MSEKDILIEEEEPIILNITLEDGTEMPSEVIGIFDVEEIEYIALLPKDREEVLLYRYKELNDEEIDLQNIESDEEFEKVSSEFWSIFEEDFEEENL